jgi:predicted ester cyclase
MTDIKNRVVDFRRRLYVDHDLTAVDDYIHLDFRSHNPLISPGRGAYRAFAASFHQGIPDLRLDIRQVMADGDRVVTFIRWEGTHTGPFLGVTPTGKKVTYETADIYRMQDGLFTEHWDVVDKLSIATELGLFGVTPKKG